MNLYDSKADEGVGGKTLTSRGIMTFGEGMSWDTILKDGSSWLLITIYDLSVGIDCSVEPTKLEGCFLYVGVSSYVVRANDWLS